jgi:FkbM family methyltransferase
MKTPNTRKALDPLLRALRSMLGTAQSQEAAFPRVATVQTFGAKASRFEITNATEAFRVEEYGGEEEFTRLLLRELRSTDVLYDIGACVGLVTVLAAQTGIHVVAFEPDPGFRSRLETNLRVNGLSSVQIVPWAVSDAAGEATLFTDGVAGRSPSLCQEGERGTVTVQTDSIDNALQRSEIPPPDVLKIDIEGAEILALRGMRGLLASSTAPRTIFIEIHPRFLSGFDSTTHEVVRSLKSFSYRQVHVVQRSGQIHCIFRKEMLM